jgi:hypothetical protein
MIKPKTLIVSSGHVPLDAPSKTFKVLKVTNSVTPEPGSYLTSREVDEYCDAHGWTVHVEAKKS